MANIDTSFEGWSFDESDPSPPSFPPIIYINSQREVDRRAKIERSLQGLGLFAERVEATDGLLLPENLRSQFFTDGCLHPTLTPAEAGCYANHLVAMQSIIDSGHQYALVLEDDAVVSPDVQEEIADILLALPRNWDFVHLCRDPWGATKPVAHTDCGISIILYSRHPGGTTGYLISRKGAKKLTRHRKRHSTMDTDLRHPWNLRLRIFGLSRRIVFSPDKPDDPLVETSSDAATEQRSVGRLLENVMRRLRWAVEA